MEVVGAENLAAAQRTSGGYFMALWHGRMIVALPGHKGSKYSVLVSPSQDGDISESLLQSFGHRVIRGSSSRGGARALREMLTALRAAEALVITPDGPRGPRHSMNLGLAWMARATGFPIVPCGFVCDRAWRARSWDRFTIPKRHARIAYVYEPPIHVARDGGAPALEAATQRIRDAMLRAERKGFELLATESDW
ncbi:MAG: lysophospholipid acyltransferase family protein [Planctomycetota bacterium]